MRAMGTIQVVEEVEREAFVMGLLTCVDKLANPNPKLMSTTPEVVMYRIFGILTINGFTNTLPAHVRPLPSVPIKATRAPLLI